ncbi:MAG: hypothetical protein KGY56_14300, partial [Desulfobacterales bacterium]|nr:hypothetical protein [Desulfobacterales bacterium]
QFNITTYDVVYEADGSVTGDPEDSVCSWRNFNVLLQNMQNAAIARQYSGLGSIEEWRIQGGNSGRPWNIIDAGKHDALINALKFGISILCANSTHCVFGFE